MPGMPGLPPKPAQKEHLAASDLRAADKTTFTEIDDLLNKSGLTDGEKLKVRGSVERALNQHTTGVINEVTRIQSLITLAVPDTVGKQLAGDPKTGEPGAIQTQVVKPFTADREKLIANVSAAFKNIGKENDVAKILNKHYGTEDKFFTQMQNDGESYVQNISDAHQIKSFASHMASNPGGSFIQNAYQEIKRFWGIDQFQKTASVKEDGWEPGVIEKQNREKEVEIAFGNKVKEEHFGLYFKKQRQGIAPTLKRSLRDTIFYTLTGNFSKAFNAEGKLGVLLDILSFNPLNGLAQLAHVGVDTRDWVDGCTISFDPQTNYGKIVMPKRWTWFPFNMAPYNYPLKALQRLIQSRACEGMSPRSFTDFPKRYRKTLTIWGIANCVFSAEDVGLPEDHPWHAKAIAARTKQSAKIGRAESIDFSGAKPSNQYDIPPCPETSLKQDNDVTIESKPTPLNDDALDIRNGDALDVTEEDAVTLHDGSTRPVDEDSAVQITDGNAVQPHKSEKHHGKPPHLRHAMATSAIRGEFDAELVGQQHNNTAPIRAK